jgi:hypothetical protein
MRCGWRRLGWLRALLRVLLTVLLRALLRGLDDLGGD